MQLLKTARSVYYARGQCTYSNENYIKIKTTETANLQNRTVTPLYFFTSVKLVCQGNSLYIHGSQ